MGTGLNVGRLVNVTVNMAPKAVARKGFGTLLIVGDSNVIDGSERIRSYTDADGVAADFGASAPEYLAAALYFGQSPKPKSLMVGRWLRTATSAILRCGVLTTAEQALSNFTAITTGSTKLTINGAVVTLSSLNFASCANLNAVAGVITTALGANGSCAWDGSKFTIMTTSTGATATITNAQPTGSGTDISSLIKMTSATAAGVVPGYAAEAAPACAVALIAKNNVWYGMMFAAATMPSDDDLVAVAGSIESAAASRLLGVTDTNANALDGSITTDIGSRLKALSYKRSCVLYSQNKLGIASMFGRAFAVNFAANRSTITLMFKILPGVVAETLTETQALALKAKNVNVYVNYTNDMAILQYGTMANGAYFDEVHGLDWFADALQTSLYNLLYQSATKIPQTDAGQNQLVNVANAVCADAVNNGLVAPGTWNADGFGQLLNGAYLKEGYYIYTPPMASQDQATRETRTAPPLTIGIKLAGAFHGINAIVNVNR